MDIARMALGFKLSYVHTMRECSRRARASCFFKFLRIFFMNNRAKNNPQPCESYFSGGTKVRLHMFQKIMQIMKM